MSQTFTFDAMGDPKKDPNLPDFSVADPSKGSIDTITWTSSSQFNQVQIYTNAGVFTETASVSGGQWIAKHTFDNNNPAHVPAHHTDEGGSKYTQEIESESKGKAMRKRGDHGDPDGAPPPPPPPYTVIVVTP